MKHVFAVLFLVIAGALSFVRSETISYGPQIPFDPATIRSSLDLITPIGGVPTGYIWELYR